MLNVECLPDEALAKAVEGKEEMKNEKLGMKNEKGKRQLKLET
jgi:hypothetical protein